MNRRIRELERPDSAQFWGMMGLLSGMSMRLNSSIPLAILFLVVPHLYGQSSNAWDRFVAAHQAGPGQSAHFTFVSRNEEFQGTWMSDDAIRRLGFSGEFKIEALDDDEARSLWARQGWGEDRHWALLGLKGELVANGSDLPQPSDLIRAMRDTGWQSRSESLGNFLREHSEQGEAWAQWVKDEAVAVSGEPAEANKVRPKKIPVGKGEASPLDDSDDPLFAALASALRGFSEVEDWPRWKGLGALLKALDDPRLARSRALWDMFKSMREQVEKALRQRPSDPDLWNAWGRFATITQDDSVQSPPSLLSSLQPAPRQPWPPYQAASALGNFYRGSQDWSGLERVASEGLSRAFSPRLMTAEDPIAYRRSALGDWGALKVEALLHEQRNEEALNAISEIHGLAGGEWPEVSRQISLVELPEKMNRNSFIEALAQPGSRDVSPSGIRPVHLGLAGDPSWRREFESLKKSAALKAWDPGRELIWTPLSALENHAVANQSWPAGPRWVLLRGGEVLDSGTELPGDADLADRLRKFDTPYLEEISAFIRNYPDHLEARGLRFALLRQRMPDLNLEAKLLEDAKALREPISRSEGWTPAEFLWQPAAQRMLPELEADLRRWPHDPHAWEAWVTWAALHPSHPQPAMLLRSLSIWKRSEDAGPLSFEILHAVGLRLRAEAAWGPLADWCAAFWEGGLRDLAFITPAPVNTLSRKAVMAATSRGKDLQDSLFSPWRESLRKLNREPEWHRIQVELEAKNPTFAHWIAGGIGRP